MPRFASAVLFVFLTLPSFSEEDSVPIPDDRGYLDNILYLCKWAKANAPHGNPVVIHVCEPGAEPDAKQAEADTQAWWDHWKSLGDEEWQHLANLWEVELNKKTARDVAAAAAETKKRREAKDRVARDKLVSRLPSMSVAELCEVSRKGSIPEAAAVLATRKAFGPKDIDLISQGSVALGMSEEAMLCALGSPEDRNRTVGSFGVHIQYVFDGLYVYTENGKVTSWQD